jgi:predicted nucleic acid-binding protein
MTDVGALNRLNLLARLRRTEIGRVAGRPVTAAGAQIAAIVRRHAATLATRNVDDFTDADVSIVDPWND